MSIHIRTYKYTHIHYMYIYIYVYMYTHTCVEKQRAQMMVTVCNAVLRNCPLLAAAGGEMSCLAEGFRV